MTNRLIPPEELGLVSIDEQVMLDDHWNTLSVESNRREQRFRLVWRALVHTSRKNPHGFLYGCGRETMQHWVRNAGQGHFSANELRAALEEGVRRGWAVKNPPLPATDGLAAIRTCTRFRIL